VISYRDVFLQKAPQRLTFRLSFTIKDEWQNVNRQ
jgi:hypothetical protein